MTDRFFEKVCLVTGAGSGIGRATATAVAREGGKVVVAVLRVQTWSRGADNNSRIGKCEEQHSNECC